MAIRIIIHMHTNLVHVAIIMMHQVSYLHKVYINYAAHNATTLCSFDVDNPAKTFIVKALPLCDLINSFRAHTKIWFKAIF